MSQDKAKNTFTTNTKLTHTKKSSTNFYLFFHSQKKNQKKKRVIIGAQPHYTLLQNLM
jgi:hypothetical protein